MKRALECLPRGGRVAVLRLRSLGDCVLTTPALRIIKRWRPDLRIAVMVEERSRAIFEDQPDTDEILSPSLSGLRRFRPDLCWNLHGATRSAWMTAASGARFRAAFAHFRHQFAYNLRIPRAQPILGIQRKVHTAEHIASGAFWLGAERGEIPAAQLGVSKAARVHIQGAHYAVIHPVASAPDKTWHAERFVAVAEHLRAGGTQPVFIGGASDDLSAFSSFRCLAGTSLRDIKSLLAGAALFLGNDSGPAHMAAAFQIPSVVIFGASDPEIWGPWRTPSETITAPAGIHSITVDRILESVARLRVHA